MVSNSMSSSMKNTPVAEPPAAQSEDTQLLANQPGERLLPGARELNNTFKEIEKRDWWTWANTILVMLLLTAAVSILALPPLTEGNKTFFHLSLKDAVWTLIVLVVFFDAYIIYQQLTIKRLRRQLMEGQGHFEFLRNMAMVDSLTGLFNRRFAENRLAAEVSRSSRRGHPLTVLSLDLDKFKEINDTYGHLAGDLVLQEFGSRLNKVVRGADLPIRMGGDEFLVILPDCPAHEMERILSRLRHIEVTFEGHKIPVHFSAGWKEYEPGKSPEELLAAADQALYSNKRAAR
jgi:diguanylate cyclase (GGDEF)-like protein